MTRLDVKLPGCEYPIFIGSGLLREFSTLFIDVFKTETAVIVSDENVWNIHGNTLLKNVEACVKNVSVLKIPPGEQSKSLAVLEELYKSFYKFELKRSGLIIAFGGGVIGDLAGFAAATYMRGTPYLQIPTTLLAQVDSSVGGKVAVNLAEGKNLVGAFYQPKMVIADTGLLDSLPEREMKAGLSEVVKYAAIGENELYSPLAAKTLDMERIVYLCCKRKAWFVERDERDNSVRRMLNFGHTFGHAIEKYYNYAKFNHGEAVAAGMIIAAQIGEKLGLTEKGTCGKIEALLKTHGLVTSFSEKLSDLIPLARGDKKNTSDKITMVLLKNFGEPFAHDVTVKTLEKILGDIYDG